MSKLDDILKQYRLSFGDGYPKEPLAKIEAEKQIKDLMLELIGEKVVIKENWNDEVRLILNSQNELRAILAKKVESL